MQYSEIRRLSWEALPPMHQWPAPLKRVILTLALIVCGLAYLILLVTVVVVGVAFLTWE